MIFTALKMYWLLIPASVIVLLDEILKNRGLNRLPDEGSLVDPGIINFAIHKNLGIAFDIPFRLEFIIFASILIGLGLLRIALKHWKQDPMISTAAIMIILGALGNLFDRVIYGFTVDYIIILGRSAINLSDLVIISGVLLLLVSSQKESGDRKAHPSHV